MTLSEIRNTAHCARGYLRAATADLHGELDARLAPMVRQGDVSYARFLLCSAMALLPIERSLEETNVAAVLPDWSQRRRSHTLRLDLAEMSLPEPPSLPAPEVLGNAFQFGMLYVLEGSRLGARLLLRDAKATLGPTAQSATRYLSHGLNLPFWPTFLRQLEASPHVRREPGQASAGARAVFQRFLTAVGCHERNGVGAARD
jgi:heme oxygenase